MKNSMEAYQDFSARFKLFISKHSDIIINTLSNIFSMRIIGNKTHGDLAEIGISEFINQFMYDFKSIHVGKDLFRKKEHEEDIVVTSLVGKYSNKDLPISLKAYGDGPLQLSTDKDQVFYQYLSNYGKEITDKKLINKILSSDEFLSIYSIHVMPLIYDERNSRCNIMIFNFKKAYENIRKILFIDKNQKYDYTLQKVLSGGSRTHPIYLFIDEAGEYVCEVRYGNASANALQRGFWTHTKKAQGYFDSLTSGWVSYSTNKALVQLIALALNATPNGHQMAKKDLQQDIDRLKSDYGI